MNTALKPNAAKAKIYVAIDTHDLDQVLYLTRTLITPETQGKIGLKLGMRFFYANGPKGVEAVQSVAGEGTSIFVDLKFHDIPFTVAGAVEAVAPLDVDYINLHATGGSAMMEAAAEAAAKFGRKAPHILAVTVLTSMDQDALADLGVKDSPQVMVERLAKLAQDSGMKGVVCSAKEVETLRASCGKDFVLMVPGIRPKGRAKDDQKRVVTPKEAMQAGATHLVIGRPILKAEHPSKAAMEILKSCK